MAIPSQRHLPPTPRPGGPQAAVVVQITSTLPLADTCWSWEVPGAPSTPSTVAVGATQPGGRKLLDPPHHPLQVGAKPLPGAAEKAYSFVRSVPG